MKNPIFTALLTLFIAACDNGLSVDMTARPKNESPSSNSASSASVDPVKQSATLHTSIEPNTPKTADWTPLFKYLETDGCASDNRPPELVRLIESMPSTKLDPKTNLAIPSPEVVVPKGYENAVGRKIINTNNYEDDPTFQAEVIVPIQGIYHGLPVKSLEAFYSDDSSTYYLLLDVPFAEAKTKLRNVHYAIPKTMSAALQEEKEFLEEVGGDSYKITDIQGFLKDYQASIGSYPSNKHVVFGADAKGKAILSCSSSF